MVQPVEAHQAALGVQGTAWHSDWRNVQQWIYHNGRQGRGKTWNRNHAAARAIGIFSLEKNPKPNLH